MLAIFRNLYILTLISFTAACETTPKLQQNFDSEPVGNKPVITPDPNPPDDSLLWTSQFATSRVVMTPGIGNEVRTIRGGNQGIRENAQVLLAYTEPFTEPGVKVRGGIDIRLIGSGKVWVGIRAENSSPGESGPGSYLGGFSVWGYRGGGSIGSLYSHQLVGGIDEGNIGTWCCAGTGMTSYSTEGAPIKLRWLIRQSERGTIELSTSAPAFSNTIQNFPLKTIDGVSNLPLKRLQLVIWIFDFDDNTILYVDNVKVEEVEFAPFGKAKAITQP
ncbi:hypothetical protein [Paracoccus ravus]|uniref:hypothetical protein n=1 Tax=Paracoccus ravus TaxID=2447760 RepID=UPI00106EB380|nr:hypothetical protein [Paracoccus ravus]